MNTTDWIIALIVTIYVVIFVGICILYNRYRYYIHRQEQLIQEGYILNEVDKEIKNTPSINKNIIV